MRAKTIVAAVGLPSLALAQSVTLHFDLDGDPLTRRLVAPSAMDHWTVYASFTGFTDPGAYFAGFVGDWVGNGSGTVVDLVNLMSGEGTVPDAAGVSIRNINIFNSALLGTNDSTNPIPIYSFTTTGVFPPLDYSVSGRASIAADGDAFTIPTVFTDISVISDLLWIPTPSAAAAFGLGIAAGSRRRR